MDEKVWAWFLERIYYVQGDFKDPAAYERLREQRSSTWIRSTGPREIALFYMAVAPEFYR